MTPAEPTIRSLTLATVAMAAALLAAGCSSSDEAGDPARGPTLVVAVSELPTSFNANESGNETQVTNDLAQILYFYAYKVGPDYEQTYPGLLRPPELVSTSPSQVVRWTIHPDAVWSDGTPVTTDDIRFYYEQVVAPDTVAAEHEGYDRIERLAVIDSKVFEATFEPAYPDYLSLWNGVPQAAWIRSQGGYEIALDNEPGPSAGPFVFDRQVPDVSITLVRNQRWWGEETPGLGSIVFRSVPDSGAQVQNLESGEIDLITPRADEDLIQQVQGLAASGAFRAELGFGPNWDLFGFNLAHPILADLRVRRAIAHALDRNAILDRVMKPMSTDARRLDSFVYMANQPQYVAHGAEYHARNLEAARALLDEAGWTGSGGVRTNTAGERLSVRVSAITGIARFEAAAELAIAQLAEIGFELRSDDCPVDCLLPRAIDGDFDILSFGWTGNTFPITNISHIFATGGPQNFGQFSNAEFDGLIGRAATVADPAEQVILANRADEVLWRALPGITLYQAPTLMAASNDFVGMGVNANGDGTFWNTQTWGPKA